MPLLKGEIETREQAPLQREGSPRQLLLHCARVASRRSASDGLAQG